MLAAAAQVGQDGTNRGVGWTASTTSSAIQPVEMRRTGLAASSCKKRGHSSLSEGGKITVVLLAARFVLLLGVAALRRRQQAA